MAMGGRFLSYPSGLILPSPVVIGSLMVSVSLSLRIPLSGCVMSPSFTSSGSSIGISALSLDVTSISLVFTLATRVIVVAVAGSVGVGVVLFDFVLALRSWVGAIGEHFGVFWLDFVRGLGRSICGRLLVGSGLL